MLDIGQLRKHIVILEKGDDSSRRQVIQTLRQHEEREWADAPPEVVHTLVETLLHQLPAGTKPPFTHKEVATILGKMGPRSKSAVPYLVEFLQEGVPDPLRETAAIALGKIGRDAKVAVDQLIALTSCRSTLAIQAVRALGDIGCADQRVRTALVNLWLSPMLSQNGQVQIATALCKLKIDARGLVEIL